MFALFSPKNLNPAEVASGLNKGEITLIDVREPSEYAAGHIQGALNMPLATIATADLPQTEGKTIVMQCAAGGRSLQALKLCRQRGLKIEHHLAGGIGARKAADLPMVR